MKRVEGLGFSVECKEDANVACAPNEAHKLLFIDDA